MKRSLAILWVATATTVFACMWDARTLQDEQKEHPSIAEIISNAGKPKGIDPTIREDIARLRGKPEPENVDWINNLAGAYLRVGEPAEAVKLLEPARDRFPDNYGVHANLGTAYHLLGRYEEAEREIARDLEINPGAHFGLEKYHLALLQYLIRDQDYQRRHVYVDEFTGEFFRRRGENLRDMKYHAAGVLGKDHKAKTREEIAGAKEGVSAEWRAHLASEKLLNDSIEWEADAPPAYRFRWDLSVDTNLVRGVMYMAELNPNEPAAMVMAGAIATQERAYNLAIAAYQRAIDLGSPQAELLHWHIAALQEHIRQSLAHRSAASALVWLAGIVLVGVPVSGIVLWRWLRKRKRMKVA